MPRRNNQETPGVALGELAERNGLTHPRQSLGPRAGAAGSPALQPIGFRHPPTDNLNHTQTQLHQGLGSDYGPRGSWPVSIPGWSAGLLLTSSLQAYQWPGL